MNPAISTAFMFSQDYFDIAGTPVSSVASSTSAINDTSISRTNDKNASKSFDFTSYVSTPTGLMVAGLGALLLVTLLKGRR